MGPIPEGKISENHNNTILREDNNFAENYLKLQRKLGTLCTDCCAFYGLYHHKSKKKNDLTF
jgi:hypothetical protein